jgi:hypothetical protein
MIDIQTSINATKSFIGSSNGIKSVFGSSLWTAVIIIIVILFMVLIFLKTTVGTMTFVKFIMYSLIGTGMILFLHDSVLYNMFKDMSGDKDSDTLMSNISESSSSTSPDDEDDEDENVPIIVQKSKNKIYNPYASGGGDDDGGSKSFNQKIAALF